MKILKPVLFAVRKQIPTNFSFRHRIFLLRHRLFHLRSPVCLPWFKMRGKQDTVNHLHRLALEINRSQIRGGMVKGAMVWPIVSSLLALYVVYRYGIWVKRKYGLSLWLQWKQIVYLANAYNLSPQSYYDFRLWNDSNRRRADQYVAWQEHAIIFDWLNRNCETKTLTRTLDNKISFFEFCHSTDIPTPPIIARFDRSGMEQWYCKSSDFPKVDLFIKPINLSCGEGVERWEHVEVCHKWKRADTWLSHSELVSYCRQLAKKHPVIVQPRLRNHPSIEQFSNGALCTLRVVSYHLPKTKPALFQSCFRMPVGTGEADNFNAGGIAAGVSERGTLGVAVGKDIRAGLFTHHPDTGVRIEGVDLPYWEQMVDLALLAHQRLGAIYFVGWDVALTINGPIVLEGNDKFGVDLAQMPQGHPLGETKYPEIVMAAANVTNPEPVLKKILVGES
jgi:Sugar-transfer associated ATP-grasp